MELLRKQIVAWADTQPKWQRDLLRRVARSPLGAEAIEELIAIVLASETAPAVVALSEEDLLGADVPEAPVSLLAIRDVVGVDALASDQNLRFAPSGLTVVYGHNGSGKSGFGRILRQVCQAVRLPTLRPNVFLSEPPPPQARIRAARGDRHEDVRLDLAENPPAWLSAVKVFDGACATTYVTAGDTVEHVPEPLGVLTRAAEAQATAAATLRARAAEIVTDTAITAKTDVEQLIGDAALSAEEDAELERLQQQLALLKGQRLEPTITTARTNTAAATRLADDLQRAATSLDDTAQSELDTCRAELLAAVTALEQLRQSALEGQPVPGTGTEPWRAMWDAARAFVTVEFPPREGDPCPLCQRAVDAETEQRLARFEKFITNDLETRVAAARAREQRALAALPDLQRQRSNAVSDLATLDEELRQTVLADITRLEQRKTALAAGTASATVDIAQTVTELRDRASAETARAGEYEALRSAQERETLTAQIKAFSDRQTTSAEADRLREKHTLLAAADRLDTGAITRRHNELAKLAISDRLIDAVRHELERLGDLADRVEAATSGTRGRTVLRVKLKGASARPGHILSEGEHRAVALALFLAQLTTGGGTSAIVFDDPVSSLDHLWRQEIATRLAEEAAHRQVIVFTHDLAFLAQLTGAANDIDVGCEQRFLSRDQHHAGVVSAAPPFAHVAYTKRAQELRRQVENSLTPLWRYNPDGYDERAGRWIVDLRKSWEMLIEEGLLRGVVRRYDPRIYTSKLKQLHIPDGAIDKINDAFRRLSAKAHHEAPTMGGTLSPTQLLDRLAEFEHLVEELRLATPASSDDEQPDVADAAA